MRKSIKKAAEDYAANPHHLLIDKAYYEGAWYVLNELISIFPREEQVPLSMSEMTEVLNKVAFAVMDLMNEEAE